MLRYALKTCTERANKLMSKTRSSKSTLQYWEKRIYKGVSTRDGKLNNNWSCAFQFGNRRMWMSLGTPIKSEAAIKARKIHLSLQNVGWELTLAKFKPAMTEKKTDVTVGEFLDAVRENCKMETGTRTGYETCLRRIVSDIFKISGDRYDYKTGGRDAWIAKVHAVKLAKLTPEKVQQWQIAFLNGPSPTRYRNDGRKLPATRHCVKPRACSLPTCARVWKALSNSPRRFRSRK